MFRAGIQLVKSSKRNDYLAVAETAFELLLYSDCEAAVELAKSVASEPNIRHRLEVALTRLIEEGKADPSKVAEYPWPGESEPMSPTHMVPVFRPMPIPISGIPLVRCSSLILRTALAISIAVFSIQQVKS